MKLAVSPAGRDSEMGGLQTSGRGFFFCFRVGLDGRAQQPQYQAVLSPPSATDWIDRQRRRLLHAAAAPAFVVEGSLSFFSIEGCYLSQRDILFFIFKFLFFSLSFHGFGGN